jgi:PKD repeat protein
MRNLLPVALLGVLPLVAIACESSVPTGPGKVVITETTTSTSTTSTTTSTIPVPPTSKFIFSPISPAAGETVFFDGADSTAGPGRRIVNYDWNFGDGNTGDGPTPSHTYAAPGLFLISLIIEDDAGGAARSTQPIQVR